MRWPAVVVAMVTMSGLVLAVAAARPEEPGTPEMALTVRGQPYGYGPVEFDIDGSSVGGLYPGATKRIELRVVNPFPGRLRITGIGAKLTSTSRRGCAATTANLEVGRYTGTFPVIVAPNSTVKLAGAIPVAMPRGATPKCADTRFRIALTALGSKDAR